MDFHSITKNQAIELLDSNELNGLSSKEAEIRILKFGKNEIEKGKKISLIKIFLSQFSNLMVFILIGGAIISFIIGELIDSLIIFIILFINATLGFIQEYKAENAMKSLMELASPHARVMRDGKEHDILSKELVPGDIIILNSGDKVPANARILKSYELEVNQAHITGESQSVQKVSEPMKKSSSMLEWNNIAFMGSIVTNGKAICIVAQTGMDTEIGKIAKNISSIIPEKTPLQNEVDKLAKALAIIVLSAVTLLFLLGIILKMDFFEMLLTSVSLAVAAVPEGLPAIITLALAFGMQRMAQKKALVRNLPSAQTLGSVTVICCDKTGTLTKNEMTVKKIFDGEKEYDISGSGYSKKGEILFNGKKFDEKRLKLLFEISSICNNAQADFEKNEIIGDPTEASLLVMAKKAGIDYNEVKKEYDEIAQLSFDSKRKMMSSIAKKGKDYFLMSKGAPESILNNCSKILLNGKEKKMTEAIKKNILLKNAEFASKALRVLGFAYKKTQKKKKYSINDESGLIFIGLAGIIDPPRDEAKDALEKAKKAGITVKMLTGDHIITAKAIAKEIGLISDDSYAVSSEDLDKLSDEEFSKIVREASVFARISPENKLRIVNELKSKGEIVASTGDGVNDAPALKASHIGISMGITGTDVTKESSQMVLLDDNFSTIISAIEEGRAIFENIKKFLKFLLASNADTIFVVTVMILFGFPLPFIPIHILWMNLITDGLPAIALSIEKPHELTMKKKPRNPNYSIVNEIGLFIIIAGMAGAACSIIAFLLGLHFEGYFLNSFDPSLSKARTMAISTAIFFELFFVFNCRDDEKSVFSKSLKENFLSNKQLTLAISASIIMQLLFIYLPISNEIFKTVPLSIYELLIVLALSSAGLLIIPKWFHKDISSIINPIKSYFSKKIPPK